MDRRDVIGGAPSERTQPVRDYSRGRGMFDLDLKDVAGSRERLRVLKIWECRRLTDVSSIARMNALRELGIMLCPKLDVATLLSAQNILGMDRVGLHATRKSDHATLVPARITAHFADLEGL